MVIITWLIFTVIHLFNPISLLQWLIIPSSYFVLLRFSDFTNEQNNKVS